MKMIVAFIGIAAVLMLGGYLWSRNVEGGDDIISARGLHWHPMLEIYVRGERVEIPKDLGVGLQYAGMPTYDPNMRMTAIHTHDDLPAIHLEFQGVVRKEDILLGTFFRIWGKDMRSFGENMRMTVDGIENKEYERHAMRDGERIELHFD